MSCRQESPLYTVDPFLDTPAGYSVSACCAFYQGRNFRAPVFQTGADSIAFISINGTVTAFRLVKSSHVTINDSTENFTDEYRNGGCDLKVDMQQNNDTPADEAYYEGIMTVKNNKGQKIVKKIAGLCGC